MVDNLDVLVMCMECKAIKVGENNWLKEDGDSAELYRELFMQYNKNLRISHGYCPECFKEVEKR